VVIFYQDFLIGPEKPCEDARLNELVLNGSSDTNNDIGISVNGLDAGWTHDQPNLQGISFSIPKQSLLVIVGQTAAGKVS